MPKFLLFFLFFTIAPHSYQEEENTIISETFQYMNEDKSIALQMSYGTPPQPHQMTLDIGSERTWLYKGLLNQSASSTFINQSTIEEKNQDLFSIKGTIVKDTTHLNTAKLNNFSFLIVKEDIDFQPDFLSALSLGHIYDNRNFSIVNMLYEAKNISRNQFSLQFLQKENKGLLHLGDIKTKVVINNTLLDTCTLININKPKWGCKLTNVIIGNVNTNDEERVKKSVKVATNKIVFHISKSEFKAIYNKESPSYFETIFNWVFAPMEFIDFLDREYFIGELQTACKKQEKDSKGIIYYKCDKSKIELLPNINIVLSGKTALVLTYNDLIKNCSGNWTECDFIIVNNENIKHWVLGIPVLQNYHTIFDYEESELMFYGEEKKFAVEMGKKSNLFIIIWFAVVIIIIIIVLFIARCYLRRKKMNKKIIENEIYSSFGATETY